MPETSEVSSEAPAEGAVLDVQGDVAPEAAVASPLSLTGGGTPRMLDWADDTDTVVEWPAYTEDEVPMLECYLPYPVDVYPSGGQKGWGLAGRIPAKGVFEPLPAIPAPQTSVWWDDDCACFKPSVVVWNGVTAGGVTVDTDDGVPVARRVYDGTLMGEWPLNPPKGEKTVNPEKARLAAEEAERDST